MQHWPWETRRLGEHRWVHRPWRPWEDPRIQGAVWLLCGATIVAAVWKLQGTEAGWLAHKAVTAVTTVILAWFYALWRAGSTPRGRG